MLKAELADHIIQNLNKFVDLDPVALGTLIEHRVPCNRLLAGSPDCQVRESESGFEVGFLGVLNGLIGTISEGPRKGWGLTTAVFDDSGDLVRFQRTSEK